MANAGLRIPPLNFHELSLDIKEVAKSKTVQDRLFLTVLTSRSLPRHSVVQILDHITSAPAAVANLPFDLLIFFLTQNLKFAVSLRWFFGVTRLHLSIIHNKLETGYLFQVQDVATEVMHAHILTGGCKSGFP